jgi:hypothetical protein
MGSIPDLLVMVPGSFTQCPGTGWRLFRRCRCWRHQDWAGRHFKLAHARVSRYHVTNAISFEQPERQRSILFETRIFHIFRRFILHRSRYQFCSAMLLSEAQRAMAVHLPLGYCLDLTPPFIPFQNRTQISQLSAVHFFSAKLCQTLFTTV